MKKWTKRDATLEAAVSPAAVNDELRASQSSITTLDRDQLPAEFVDQARLETYALHRVYVADKWGTGEQTSAADADVLPRAWKAATYQTYTGGWLPGVAGTTVDLTGFKGGHLFIEWSGNAYVFGPMADGANQTHPGTPRHMRLRILVSGVVLAEQRGPAYHESFRIFGTGVFPSGDLSVQLQWRLTEPGSDDPIETNNVGNNNVVQGHIYSQRYFAIGRFR